MNWALEFARHHLTELCVEKGKSPTKDQTFYPTPQQSPARNLLTFVSTYINAMIFYFFFIPYTEAIIVTLSLIN